jgi:hypothetical protein
MEDYFSLYGITDELANSGTVFSIQIKNVGNGGNGEKMFAKGMWVGHTLRQRFMNSLTLTPTI